MSGAILNVKSRPIERVRQQEKYVAFFLFVNPTTAVKKNQRESLMRRSPCARQK